VTQEPDPVFDRRQRSWLFRTRVNAEVDAELTFHLEMRIRHYLALGVPADEAQTRACRDLGDVDRVRRLCRTLGHQRDERMRRTQYLDELRQDVTFALRQLRVAPVFAAVALVTLALGIGATTAIFSLVRGVLLTPLPYADPDRLIVARVSLPDYRDLKAGTSGFSHLAVWASNLETFTGSGEPEQVLSGQMSPEMFETLGVKPLIGRTFTEQDGAARLVVLSHGLWQRRFGGDRTIVGRTIELARKQAVVIGVMPPMFEFPSREYELWLPLSHTMARAREQSENRALRIFRAVGRLGPGETLAQVQAQADAVAARLRREHPQTNAGVDLPLVPLYERLVGEARRPLLMLLAVVTLVLLIGCINVANLLLARALTRERELAIRAALGAGRGRLVRQLLTESVLLAACGGLLGLLAARATLSGLVRLVSPLVPRVDAIHIDGAILLFAIGVSMLTGIVFGLAPSLQQHGGPVGLREAGRGVAGQVRGRRMRGALITLEVALAVVVLVCAGLLLRSLLTLGGADPGFVADRLLTMNVVLVAKGGDAERAAAARSIVERLTSVPGVEAVGGATGLPPETAQRGTSFEAEGVTRPDGPRPSAYFIAATPGYFRALGTRVLRGRAFDARDTSGGAPVMIINESLARSLYPGQDAVGRRVRLINPEQPNTWRTVVGVVADVRYQGLEDEGDATVYTPFDQTPFLWTYVFVRTYGEPAAMTRSVARAIAEIDPELIPARLQPMSMVVAKAVEARRASALLLSAFALVALMLAAIGIGGLVSYAVSRRTSEMAVRLALGATPGRVLALVLSQALTPVAVGAAIGLAGALAATRLVESLLFGVTPYDSWTFVTTACVLSLVTLTAAYLPARRALAIAPADALRVS
jgi:putative ABC transport system permease protein